MGASWCQQAIDRLLAMQWSPLCHKRTVAELNMSAAGMAPRRTGSSDPVLNSCPIWHSFKRRHARRRETGALWKAAKAREGWEATGESQQAPYRADSQDSRQALREQISRGVSAVALLGERELRAKPWAI